MLWAPRRDAAGTETVSIYAAKQLSVLSADADAGFSGDFPDMRKKQSNFVHCKQKREKKLSVYWK